MILSATIAKDIVDAVHAAWSAGNVEGMLAWYVDDLTYWSNTGGLNGTPLTILGKSRMRAFLSQNLDVTEGMSVVDSFQFSNGQAHCNVYHSTRHKMNGMMFSGSYRQLVTFHTGKIIRLEEFRDGGKMAALSKFMAS